MTGEEANQVAERLGDLPIAVAAAGAWLYETGGKGADYVREIDRLGPMAIGTRVGDVADSAHAVRRPGTCRWTGCGGARRRRTGCCSSSR